MKKSKAKGQRNELRPEYDFSKGVRGKYFERYRSGTNLALISSDVQKAFPDSESVNRALRQLMKIAKKSAHL